MVTHPTPWQVWALQRGVAVRHCSSHDTQDAATKAADKLARADRGRAYGVVEITKPALGVLYKACTRGGTLTASGSRTARDLGDLERLRSAAPGTTCRALGLSVDRAHRLVRALEWGHLGGSRDRGGVAVPPARGPDGTAVEVRLQLVGRRYVVARDGVVEPPEVAEAAALRLVVAHLAHEQCEGRRPGLRALRRLLGWPIRRVAEVRHDAVEVRRWLVYDRTGVGHVTPAGRRRALASLEAVVVAPVGGEVARG